MMMSYRLTAPGGASGYSDLNPAAVTAYKAKPGWRIELVGPSKIQVVDEPEAAPEAPRLTTAELAKVAQRHQAHMSLARHWSRQEGHDLPRAIRYTRRYARMADRLLEGIEHDERGPALAGELTELASLLERTDRKFTRDERPDLFARLDTTYDRIAALTTEAAA